MDNRFDQFDDRDPVCPGCGSTLPLDRWEAGRAFCARSCEKDFRRLYGRRRCAAVIDIFKNNGEGTAITRFSKYIKPASRLDGLPLCTIRALIDYPQLSDAFGWPAFDDDYWADCGGPGDYMSRVRECVSEAILDDIASDAAGGPENRRHTPAVRQ